MYIHRNTCIHTCTHCEHTHARTTTAYSCACSLISHTHSVHTCILTFPVYSTHINTCTLTWHTCMSTHIHTVYTPHIDHAHCVHTPHYIHRLHPHTMYTYWTCSHPAYRHSQYPHKLYLPAHTFIHTTHMYTMLGHLHRTHVHSYTPYSAHTQTVQCTHNKGPHRKNILC